MSTPELPEVFASPSYLASPCRDCDIPGYLILHPRKQTDTIAGIQPESLAELGPVLARLETAIYAATGAEHVYVVRFSESLSAVHFHLFPRTRELAERWREAAPDVADQGINAPLLFAWARIHRYVPSVKELSPETLAMAVAIAAALAESC